MSEFKAKCLALFETVRRTGTPVLVTRRGRPLAVVSSAVHRAGSWLGAMSGTVLWEKDIVSPMGEDDWEAARN